MKARIAWKGSSEEVHPVLGRLIPHQVLEVDVAPELLADLRADASGLFAVTTDDPARPAARTRGAAAPAVPVPSSQGEEDKA